MQLARIQIQIQIAHMAVVGVALAVAVAVAGDGRARSRRLPSSVFVFSLEKYFENPEDASRIRHEKTNVRAKNIPQGSSSSPRDPAR